MEQLSKQQLILLALLVSFVTSIATGIVTVSLMDQAPQGVTQTINRVVEKTIERVVTEPAKQTASVVTKETVVVKADDAVIDAVAKNGKSIIRIKEVTEHNGARRESFAGIGLIVSAEGHIAADIAVAYRAADAAGNSIPETYTGVFSDGRVFPLNIAYSNPSVGIIFFQPLLQDREKGTYKFAPPAFNTGELKLGQAIVALGGVDSNAVFTGIISSFTERSVARPPETGTDAGAEERAAEKKVTAIRTDLRSSELASGTVLLNLSGEVVGLSAGAASVSRNTFVPTQKVLEELAKIGAAASAVQ
jgi:S1-C subfamily serine protease